MKKTKIISILICCIVVCFSLLFANVTETNAADETGRADHKIATGITEQMLYLNTNGKNVRVYMLRIDKNANVSFKASTKNYYKKGSTKASRKKVAKKWKKSSWGYSKVSQQAVNYNKSKDSAGTVVAGINGDFFYYGKRKDSGLTYGNLILEGNKIRSSTKEPYFAVMKNGSYEIRDRKSSTKSVSEAVSGRYVLKNGNVPNGLNYTNHPRLGLGIMSDGSILIMCSDGRQPDSPGLTEPEMGEIFKQAGCTNALNFDGGGSASFLTKRSGNKSLGFRNIPGDGFIRNVSSSLLIVKNKKSNGKTVTGNQKISLLNENTKLTKNEAGDYIYLVNGQKAKEFQMINGKSFLFDDNGNGISTTIKIGAHNYKYTKGALASCSDKKAGTVKVGYCGASDNGKNLIFAYHPKDKVLNIGINPYSNKKGNMKNWIKYEGALPWYSLKGKIKTLNLSSGVKNVGDFIFQLDNVKGFEGSKPQKSLVSKLKLPASVTTIGKCAFYFNQNVKNVTIPKNVSKIKASAFEMAGKGYIRFTSSKPPKFGKAVFKKSKFKTVYVKKTSAWKKFVKAKKFQKLGLKKAKIKYK